MRTRIAIALSALILPAALFAQVAVNPQLGVTFQNLTPAPANTDYRAAVGFMLGADLRIGKKFYFQPGVFFERNVTTVQVGDSAVVEDDLVRSSLKMKALVGLNVVNGKVVRLRLNTGPSYDVLLSVDNRNDDIEWNRSDFNTGSFNWNAGLGVDLSIVTVETGLIYGLSNVFKNEDGFSNDAKYFTIYATAGVVIGGRNGR